MKRASGWEKASTIALWLQTLAVIGSLAFIAYQVWQQTKLTKAANAQALVGLITPLNLKITEPEMTELWIKGEEEIEKVADLNERKIKQRQYQTLLSTHLIFYENVFTQHVDGLLVKKIYQGWDNDLATFIKEHKIAKHWHEWRYLYREDFAKHVHQIIEDQKSQK